MPSLSPTIHVVIVYSSFPTLHILLLEGVTYAYGFSTFQYRMLQYLGAFFKPVNFQLPVDSEDFHKEKSYSP